MHHLQDQAILRRSHGLKQIAAVQHTKAAIPKKRLNAAADGGDAAVKCAKVTAPGAGAAVYPLGVQSRIEGLRVASKPKQPMPKGNNNGIPLDKQKYCEFCHKWSVDYQGHSTGMRHNGNVKAGVKWFWCYTCEDNILTSDKESHVCSVD